MKTTLNTIAAAGLLLAAGCSSPCEHDPEPRPANWAAHPDWIAPGGTLCRAEGGSATVDYEHDQNPFVVIVDYLEADGWARTTQDIDDPTFMTVSFEKGADTLDVTISDDGDYGSATYRVR